MKKIKRYAGYINLKPINGVLYPSSIQNILMKNYVTDNLKGKFYLSPTEVLQAQNPITLNTLISNEVKVDGIVIGGLLMGLYAKPRTTFDIDILFISETNIPDSVIGFKKIRPHSFEHIKTNVEVEVLSPEYLNPIDHDEQSDEFF